VRRVIVNFSGGKDSTVAILEAIKRYPKEEIILCYQDTGAEYKGTAEHVQSIADILGLELVTLRAKRDWYEQVLHDRIPEDYCVMSLQVFPGFTKVEEAPDESRLLIPEEISQILRELGEYATHGNGLEAVAKAQDAKTASIKDAKCQERVNRIFEEVERFAAYAPGGELIDILLEGERWQALRKEVLEEK